MITLSQNKKLLSTLVVACVASSAAFSATITVNQIQGTYTGVEDDWYANDIRAGGTASILDLTSAGGDLFNNQPLGPSAVKLTTGLADNGDKAEIGTAFDFGLASEVLNAIDIGYSFFKATVGGGNAFAAPTLKIAIAAANHSGANDGYGQLVFEPTWNTGATGSAAPSADAWVDVALDQDSGSGADGYGGWWWTGGFEIGNSFGGPPIKSLSEWASALGAADPSDFSIARVVGISVGVGTYNLGQEGYFDSVYIKTGNYDKTYDFEVPSDRVPDSGSMLSMLAGGLLCLVGMRRFMRNR